MWFNTPATTDVESLSPEQQKLIVLRHTHCSVCECKGVQPVTEGAEECTCDHVHPLPSDSEELLRRVKVACRIDELLQDKGRLEDFDFEDEDIHSLRLQMSPPDEEAAPVTNGHTNGTKRRLSSEKEESPTKKIKISTGLETVSDFLLPHYHPPKVKASVIEEEDGLIQFRVVNNDNSPMNMIILTGLKNIFQKQLPKMPREYIARLIYDRNHLSMAIVRGVDTGKIEVIGGITYRPFNHRKFAEIVFCAIASNEQVRGYGAHLMNHLKDYVKASSPIIHFLTYADNYAIGYFKKQGFTKDINLERQIWVGYIKDYEGGTIMQCTVLPRIRYLDSADIMARQKAAILWKIAKTSSDHIVYPGLEVFRNGGKVRPEDIPGLKETGWTREMDEIARKPKRPGHHQILQALLAEMQNHPSAWPFVQPVNREEVPDYYEVIKEPMGKSSKKNYLDTYHVPRLCIDFCIDLTAMEFKLENDQYESVAQFVYDAKLIFNNCRSYNNETTTYYKNASKLERALSDVVKEKFVEYSALV